MRTPKRYNYDQPVSKMYIYGLKDPIDDRYRYVGQTHDIDRRLRQHIESTGQDRNLDKHLWIRHLKESGKAPVLEVLECCDVLDADAREIYWINRLRGEEHPLLNQASGGTGRRMTSKLKATEKHDWIRLGYTTKNVHDGLVEMICEVSDMCGVHDSALAHIQTAHKEIKKAKMILDDYVRGLHANWSDVGDVFCGNRVDHPAPHDSGS